MLALEIWYLRLRNFGNDQILANSSNCKRSTACHGRPETGALTMLWLLTSGVDRGE
jgi:hypothetical protein